MVIPPILSTLSRRKDALGVSLASLFLVGAFFTYELAPIVGGGEGAARTPVRIEVRAGDGFEEVADTLRSAGLVRSALAFKVFTLIRGVATSLKSGVYELSPAMSTPEIVSMLAKGTVREVTVVIPEGSSRYEIDKVLTDAGVVKEGEFLNLPESASLEGNFFPDTYKFFLHSSAQSAMDKLLANFAMKAKPLLDRDPKSAKKNLILASLVEKEVPDADDRRIVIGVLEKRLRAGMPLQVDATNCYIKKQRSLPPGTGYCYPLTPLDFAVESPYNTYLHVGLPPGPIGSPGVAAITAVLSPKASPYWFYLSDPATGKTIFSETLDEQEQNKIKYLKVK